jgi:hypothetical protein
MKPHSAAGVYRLNHGDFPTHYSTATAVDAADGEPWRIDQADASSRFEPGKHDRADRAHNEAALRNQICISAFSSAVVPDVSTNTSELTFVEIVPAAYLTVSASITRERLRTSLLQHSPKTLPIV